MDRPLLSARYSDIATDCDGVRPANRSDTRVPARPLRNALAVANVLTVVDQLEAAAEPTRRRLLQLLATGEQTVNALASNFAVSRSAISQHLGVLTDAGLVVARKEGRFRYYRVEPKGLARLRALFESFWNDELDRLVADAAAVNTREGEL